MFLRRCVNGGHHCYSADSAIELQELSGKTAGTVGRDSSGVSPRSGFCHTGRIELDCDACTAVKIFAVCRAFLPVAEGARDVKAGQQDIGLYPRGLP